MSRVIYRYEVPVDWEPHELFLYPVAVPARVEAAADDLVEFWMEHDSNVPVVPRSFRVFGTSHTIPDSARWMGTTGRTDSGLVWHLYELIDTGASR